MNDPEFKALAAEWLYLRIPKAAAYSGKGR